MPKLKINFWLLGILFFIFLLRLPSFFEPHWYGDEEIYLVLGEMMRRGAVLYRDIWDNKTPLLYVIYAISPTLLWAKLSATAAVLGTITGVFYLFKKSYIAALLTGTLLSLPILEGTIANAELYFTLPITLGAIMIWQRRNGFWIGVLAAIAFLLKVPAILDFAGLGLAMALIKFEPRKIISMAVGFIVPVVAVFGYFALNHALGDFVTAAFSQNASYVSVDSGPLSKLSNPLFIKGIILAFGSGLLAFSYRRKLISAELLFLGLWFGFSLYGALLSNRPYRHYLLQIVPPAVLLFTYLVAHLRQYMILNTLYIILLVVLARSFVGAFALEPRSYYQNFFNYISEREAWTDYASYFDPRTLNGYAAAQYIIQNTNPSNSIFVWGDTASIYDLSDRPAATKFIQAHHLTTIPASNYNLIMERLVKFQPKIIAVTRPVQFPFPSLEDFLAKDYCLAAKFGSIYLYQNFSPVTPPPWSPEPI
ncbi:MAG: hypothetical protein M1484_05045 [Patescibacteria group bacterium]|nr:hypothetical protein [Patescibacteria group bacterium]MCL5432420.1 hypothetical protein [Patescibacteria group bacterium]